MGANYRAILSDSTQNAIGLSSSFLMGGTSRIFNTQGDLVAPNYASMFQGSTTSLNNAIRYDEFGSSANLGAWTGTNAIGLHSGRSCSNWTAVQINPLQPCERGGILFNTASWVTTGANSNYMQPLRLYGISEKITVVPEPASLLFAGIGIVGLLLKRRDIRSGNRYSRSWTTRAHQA